MTKDIIYRQDAIELAMQYCPDDDGICSKANEDMRNLLDELENLPSAVVDSEPIRHGHWIGENQTKLEKLFFPSRVFKCSVCGNYLDFDGINVGRGSANYCPNCGCVMDERKEDD